MKFRSRLEAYTTAWAAVRQLASEAEGRDSALNSFLKLQADELMQAILSHSTDTEILKKILQTVIDHESIDFEIGAKLKTILEIEHNSDYEQSTAAQWENVLGRALESIIAVPLLLSPTENMCNVAYELSERLIPIINKNIANGSLEEKDFTKVLLASENSIALGSFADEPKLETILDLLKDRDNYAKNFTKILFIQFVFARDFYRDIKEVEFPNAENTHENLRNRFANDLDLNSKHLLTMDERKFIPDIAFYGSELYTAVPGRGRQGRIDENCMVTTLGLFLLSQNLHTQFLPPSNSPQWVADASAQAADLSGDNPYVQQLLATDIPYVAGPSGMSSLFLGQFEMVANLPTMEQKQEYLAAVVGYIVGGGFHSIHEVIGPAQYVLGLVPGYSVSMPREGKLSPDSPPDYNVFINLLKAIDPQYERCYQETLNQFFQYFTTIYQPNEKLLYSDKEALDQLKKILVHANLNKDSAPSAGVFIGFNIAPGLEIHQIHDLLKDVHSIETFFVKLDTVSDQRLKHAFVVALVKNPQLMSSIRLTIQEPSYAQLKEMSTNAQLKIADSAVLIENIAFEVTQNKKSVNVSAYKK